MKLCIDCKHNYRALCERKCKPSLVDGQPDGPTMYCSEERSTDTTFADRLIGRDLRCGPSARYFEPRIRGRPPGFVPTKPPTPWSKIRQECDTTEAPSKLPGVKPSKPWPRGDQVKT